MRIANITGRLNLLADEGGAIDVEKASGGRFTADPQAVYAQWDDFRRWGTTVDLSFAEEFDDSNLQAPVPRSTQIFAIGLNYRDHASEASFDVPVEPAVFTKFQSCLTGPFAEVKLPTDTVDWETELVAVIAKTAYQVDAADAWDYVAGLTIGQDLSERRRQLVPPAPQFSLGKSFPGFAPMGPSLVTVDELNSPDDLELGCSINGEQMQKSRTSNLILSIPELIARLSAVLPLQPGDVIFTGTPSGVGQARNPQRFLKPGDTLMTWIEGLGEMHTTFSAGQRYIMASGKD